MKKNQVYLLALLLSIISCKNVEQEKQQTVSINESTASENQNESEKTIDDSQLNSNSEISEEISILENQNSLNIEFSKIDSIAF